MPDGYSDNFEYGQSELARDIHRRLQSLATWVGWLGTTVVISVVATLAMVDEGNSRLYLVAASYVAIFQLIRLSAQRDFHTRILLNAGLTLIYVIFWAETFTELYLGESLEQAVLFSIVFPVLIIAIMNPRIILALIPVQFAAVYVLASNLNPLLIPTNVAPEYLNAYCLTVAGLSAVMFLALGIVSSERSNSDRRLVALVGRQERIASTDSLTGLPNRRSFLKRLELIWSRDIPMTLAFVDLDHFKPLNDQYGHAMGDEVLKEVANRLQQVPGAEAVARLGGDEFAAVFSSAVAEDSIQTLVSRLHSDITADFDVGAGTVSLGASIGYAHKGVHTHSLSELLGAADAAMRRAKASRSGWALFDSATDGAALASSTLKLELKQAIRERRIRAALQPIARADTFEVTEYELLARWPDSGLTPDPGPDKFIHLAEQLGLLNEILWMTLAEAATVVETSTMRLALNVSPAQLLATGFVAELRSKLDRLSIDPSRVTLEITEEVAFRNLEQNVSVLTAARDTGMLIALDDFGSGYSSLAMLDVLPLDKLKIDQSLVKKAEGNERSADILHASIKLAKQLDLVCCVEGVESAMAAQTIRQLGADEVQGYWIGRPSLLKDLPKGLKLVS